MAFGVNHVAFAPSRGGRRGRAHFRPLPTTQHTTTDPTESTGSDVG